jgi:hypothetical protein
MIASGSGNTIDRHRILRRLRIAFSVACGIVSLSLIVLWVRSYWHADIISGPALPKLKCGTISLVGRIVVVWSREPPFPSKWEVVTREVTKGQPFFRQFENMFGFGVVNLTSEQEIILPHWFLVAITATCAVAPWLNWIRWPKRFSLRTLLVATTFVALLLGAIVYAVS